MLKFLKVAFFSLLVMLPFTGSPDAKVSPEEANKLGNELTALGGERAGNADNTIPEYTGGLKTPPAGYVPGKGFVDPYAKDPIMFTITAKNMAQYKDKLTPGQQALFKAYPETFKMNVYPTRRSAACPQFVYDAAKYNAVNAEVNTKNYNLTNWKIGIPFPIPKTGLEAIFNVIMNYAPSNSKYYSCQAITNRDGSFSLIKFYEEAKIFGSDAGSVPDPSKRTFFKQAILAPPREAGRVLLVHVPSDIVTNPQNAWIYNPGQRRVRRAPSIKYDGPGTSSDGLRTTDDYNVFNGAPDKYDWKLAGKKEIYVAYNNYKLNTDKNVKYKDILTKGHINQDLVRYELHRVWVLEATLKPEMRHIYKKRVLYVDEDSWIPLMADSYDNREQLWRVIVGHNFVSYQIPVASGLQVNVYHDLQSGRYLVQNLRNEEKGYVDYQVELAEKDFTPAALRRSGRR